MAGEGGLSDSFVRQLAQCDLAGVTAGLRTFYPETAWAPGDSPQLDEVRRLYGAALTAL